jgi:hypothetical protein
MRMFNWRLDEAIRDGRGFLVGKGIESDVESRDFHNASPHLCRLRTDELIPMSKY